MPALRVQSGTTEKERSKRRRSLYWLLVKLMVRAEVSLLPKKNDLHKRLRVRDKLNPGDSVSIPSTGPPSCEARCSNYS